MQWNKEKLKKELGRLYIGQNPEKLVIAYYKKKHKEMMLMLIAGILIVTLSIYKDIKNSTLEENNAISRNDTGEGKETVVLQIKEEGGDWQEIEFELYPKEYSNEELEAMFLEVSTALEDKIKKENQSLNEVVSDLELLEEVEGYPFEVHWTSTPEGYIDESGKLLKENQTINQVVELRAEFEYGDWKKEKIILIRIIKEEPNTFLVSLKQYLEAKEVNTRNSGQFYLPEAFQDKNIKWSYPRQNRGLLLGIIFMFLYPLISYEKDKEIYSMSLKRKKQLQNTFPEFITKLTLLLEAGLSIRNAMFYMVKDYEKISHKGKIYLYEELSYVCIQIKNGMPEKEGYELLAKRCSLPCYKKIAGMLIQHLYKGGNYILEELKKESQKATEEQKRMIQKKGEEMGTKLLFPMLLMLGIVMVFIMVPALFSFQA